MRALAVALGIDPSYDLPAAPASDAARHGDARLQTLLTPDELEARLQKMQASAVTAIQESGANMLHLLFGFVEWTDVAGEKTRMAPLVLLPVAMSRLTLDPATHTYPYTVAASGEDWSTNVTLQEMCRKNFGFVLPSVEAEEDLEHYFSRVEEVLRVAASSWTLRRQLTLGLVSFGKILMWRDLDPATWPARARRCSACRCSVRCSATRSGGERGARRARPAATDDGVQHRRAARRAAASGAADRRAGRQLAAQRADRRAARRESRRAGTAGHRQVADDHQHDRRRDRGGERRCSSSPRRKPRSTSSRARLVDAGLGPFSSPLHSHTSNKREFLDDLKARIDLRPPDGAAHELTTVEGLLAEARKELTGHVERLHRAFGSLGLTAFDILWRARRLGGEIPEGVVAALRGATIPNVEDGDAVGVGEAPRHAAGVRGGARRGRGGRRRRARRIRGTGCRAPISRSTPRSRSSRWRACAREALASAEARAACAGVGVRGVAWPDSPEGARCPLLARVRHVVAPDADVPSALIEAIHARAGESATRAAVEAADAARHAWSAVEGAWGAAGALDPGPAQRTFAASPARRRSKMLSDEATVDDAQGSRRAACPTRSST